LRRPPNHLLQSKPRVPGRNGSFRGSGMSGDYVEKGSNTIRRYGIVPFLRT
jgi:hypothetical protein